MLALLLFALGWALLALRQDQRQEEQRRQAADALDLLRERLETAGRASFEPAATLAALIQADGELSEARWRRLMDGAPPLPPQVRGLRVTPAQGPSLGQVQPDWAAALDEAAAREPAPGAAERAPTAAPRHGPAAHLLGPIALPGGRSALVQQRSLYLPGEGGGALRYWGRIALVADLDLLLRAAGLDPAQAGDLSLSQDDGGTPAGRLLWGSPAAADQGSLRTTLGMPGARWVLSRAVDPALLAAPSPRPLWLLPWICAALALLMAGLLHQAWRLRRSNRQLRARVDAALRLQDDMESSKARFRTLAMLASDWVWEQDAQLRFTYVSRLGEDASDPDAGSVLGRQRWELPGLLPMDWRAHQACLQRRETFRDFEYSLYQPDGRLRHVTVSGAPFYDAQGQFQGYRGIGRNITAAREAEARLRQSQADAQTMKDRLQAVLDAAVEVAIIATDAQDRVLVFNAGAERMLGYRSREVLGLAPALLGRYRDNTWHGLPLTLAAEEDLHTLEASAGGDPAPLANGTARRRVLVRADGRRVEVSLTISRVLSRAGEPIGHLWVARDIGQQLQAERELQTLNAELEARVQARTRELSEALEHLHQAQDELLRSEKMAALGSLVAGVAHELNTPLGNCLTTASTLSERTQEVRRAMAQGSLRRSVLEHYLVDAGTSSELLLRGLHAAAELVTHFKQLSVDQTSEQRRHFQLEEVVNDVLGLARARWRTTPFQLESQIEVERQVDGYPGPLGQVLGNLLQNALLHAFEGRDQGRLRIVGRPLDAQHFLLEVADDGRGMSDEVRRRAFDPFFTTKLGRGGSGLGLNIVYNIVTGPLGGELELHSAPGQGSRFVFRLPYVAPQFRPANQ
ncbi:PAS domain-containing sensor histidine kinase [Pelomonas sp. CA6]|uniref:PAS domain-containing sensor histidine kinase n=1 Tax=Pelomonas sp. CA6 TaxID=2907999 RepID=UPI001F4BE879|nr:PAS domain-containing sensor histidine kinase [Pelomonas sp. CA6]MCH7344962.1 PAS domain-containing sensor histidine kinase [Pelomonas sp. CA6]